MNLLQRSSVCQVMGRCIGKQKRSCSEHAWANIYFCGRRFEDGAWLLEGRGQMLTFSIFLSVGSLVTSVSQLSSLMGT